jgi:hypothetical protein
VACRLRTDNQHEFQFKLWTPAGTFRCGSSAKFSRKIKCFCACCVSGASPPGISAAIRLTAQHKIALQSWSISHDQPWGRLSACLGFPTVLST